MTEGLLNTSLHAGTIAFFLHFNVMFFCHKTEWFTLSESYAQLIPCNGYNFSPRVFGDKVKRTRYCQKEGFQRFTWLHYHLIYHQTKFIVTPVYRLLNKVSD